MANVSVPHPMVGQTRVFRVDLPPYDPALDNEPGVLVIAPGMRAEILAYFTDWNDVPGLELFYVRCLETGLCTHVSPSELT